MSVTFLCDKGVFGITFTSVANPTGYPSVSQIPEKDPSSLEFLSHLLKEINSLSYNSQGEEAALQFLPSMLDGLPQPPHLFPQEADFLNLFYLTEKGLYTTIMEL